MVKVKKESLKEYFKCANLDGLWCEYVIFSSKEDLGRGILDLNVTVQIVDSDISGINF